MYRNFFKRVLDIVLSGLGIVLLALPMLGIALAIKLGDPGPVLFRQKRFGRDESHFYILKFRTMRTDTPKDMPTHLLADPESFITPMGRFLRRTSLDELPQLFNIFAGQMSVVGPRPALWNQYDLMALRKENGSDALRPGLTGWAQINGRDEIALEEKARLDGEYAARLSLGFDLRCFFGTFLPVLRGQGVKEGGPQTK